MVHTEHPDATKTIPTRLAEKWEDINEGENTFEIDVPPKIGLVDVLGSELRELAQIGIGLKRRIADAKTAPKKRLYQKKLEKNSKKAAEIILYLERVQIGKAIKENQEKQQFIHERNNEDGQVSDSAATGRRTSEEGSET